MLWKCKYCEFMCEKRGYLLKHYLLKHGNYGRTVPFPCLHQKCVCTFKSINALKVHLAKIHQKTQAAQLSETPEVTFHCQSCDFSAPCTETVFLTHLRSTHLKVNHRVQFLSEKKRGSGVGTHHKHDGETLACPFHWRSSKYKNENITNNYLSIMI